MFSPADYHFELPPELIAQQPAERRDGSRLLHVGDAAVSDHAFGALADLVPADAVVIANDTRVIPARVRGHKPSGGAIELLFLEPAADHGDGAWRALARGTVRAGQVVVVDGVELRVLADRGDDHALVIAVPGDPLAFLDRHGHVPLPPYIERADEPTDRERYQTMFARVPGAVAAPTAGLHMTPAIAAALEARGVALATITLHVGWGTFAPIREADVRAHRMHRERFVIPESTCALVASGRPVVALGTTTLRALEAAAIAPRQVAAGPGATLLMLVCAFAGTERVLAAYRHAVAARYRFFSYGDAMLVHRS